MHLKEAGKNREMAEKLSPNQQSGTFLRRHALTSSAMQESEKFVPFSNTNGSDCK